jgi:flagellar protein FlaG
MNIVNALSGALRAPAPEARPVAEAAAVPMAATRKAAAELPPDLADTVAQANRQLAPSGRQLAFEWDKDAGAVIVTLRDAVTNEVIRQMPSAEAVALAESLARMQDKFLVTA